ncbi:hypothetical protein [Sphingomonas sp. CARO-RG-8B-R24-01]|uniref:hypothetical protein n=1 Tax=Sphingomonas sp. CARO-RG-8B-R24-01 TaxID=2914831 RepID=UPI001F55FA3C|nr:hypothetical protein [Sphingomonas sp. CARO-RG-8B-R24-01]
MALSINSQFASFGADGTPELVSLHDLKQAAGVPGVENAVADNAAAAAAALAETKAALQDAIATARAQLDLISGHFIPTINAAVADAGTNIAAAKQSADDGILAANTKIDTIAIELTQAGAQQASATTALAISTGSPTDFTARGLFYAENAWQPQNAQLPDRLFVPDGLGSYHYLNNSSGGNYSVALRSPLRFAGRTYRYQALLRAVGADGSYSPDFEWSNNQTGAEGGTYTGSFTPLPVSAGWVTVDYVIDGTSVPYVWLNPHLRGAIGVGGKIEIAYFRCVDVTTTQSIAAINTLITSEQTVRQNADVALGQRIDSVAASGGYNDTDVYAEVHRVDQAAIDRDAAIGQSIASVTSGYQNANTTTNARIDQVATTASTAQKSVSDLSTSVDTRFQSTNLTLTNYDQRITSLSTAQQGYAGQVSSLQATVGPADGSKPSLMARVQSNEDALVNLPNQYAATSRTAALEAQVNGTDASNLLARANTSAAAIADSKVGAITQSVSTLQSQYNGISATITQQAGTIAGVDGRTAVYFSVTGTTPDGSTQIQLSKSDGSVGQFYVGANMIVDGNLLVNGTINTVKISPNAITQWANISGGTAVVAADGGPVDSGSVSLTTQGNLVKIDVSFDAVITTGTGASFSYQIYRDGAAITRAFNVLTTTVSGYQNMFVTTEIPAAGSHYYQIIFSRKTGGSSELHISNASIFVQEFKR